MSESLDQLCVNTIRMLSVDAVEKAKSGHPGAPMGLAPTAYVLWTRFLKHNPRNPSWPDRDRFVLPAGHASLLIYSMLHLTGYDLPLEQIQQFRQWGSRTPGHPEWLLTPGVEATTGPLGQGTANAIGMAIAERALAARFNRPGHDIVNHRTFALVSDGDLMEGIAAEAASLASKLGLGRIVYLYDDNDISLDGPTELSFDTEDVAKRFDAYRWHVQTVDDANDLGALEVAIDALKNDKQNGKRPPSAIILLSDGKTTVPPDPVPIARTAGQLKIPIYTVTLGTATGTITVPPLAGGNTLTLNITGALLMDDGSAIVGDIQVEDRIQSTDVPTVGLGTSDAKR